MYTAMLLLALTGGMFLLAKSNKDNLGIFYKIVSWFVIVAAMLALVCCTLHCVMGNCAMKDEKCNKEMMMWRGGNCEDGKMEKCHEMKMCRDDDNDETEEMGEAGKAKCCKPMGDGKDCPMKKEMKKDSVVIKK